MILLKGTIANQCQRQLRHQFRSIYESSIRSLYNQVSESLSSPDRPTL